MQLSAFGGTLAASRVTNIDYNIDKPGFSAEFTRLAEDTEIHHDLGMKYENIEAISANRADFLRQKSRPSPPLPRR